MHGLFLIDKSKDMTSYDVIRQLKKKFNISKIGHAGTLDPFATGLLIVLVGHATKLSNLFLTSNKKYEVTIRFGQHTSTYDYTGQVLKEDTKIINQKDIQDTLPLLSHYQQEPPMVSAIKLNGKKLYELAREGKEVEREKRYVTFYEQDIVDFQYPLLNMNLYVSKGTYIRSYAVDLASHLQTYAHITQLRRVQSGQFDISFAKTLDDVTLEDLIPVETLLNQYPKITVTPFIASKIKHGLLLDHRQFNGSSPFCVYNEDQQFIAFYEPKNELEYKIVFFNEDTL